MYKIPIALATITILASCTLPGATPPTTPTKQMTPDAMMQKETILKDAMKHDDKMMSGSWTPEEMATMDKEDMMSGSAMMMDDKMGTGHDMMQKEMPKTEVAIKSHGYMDYSPELVTSALQSWQKVVLFFAASWCPSCKALDQAIQADLGSIGMDTLIVRVDYDTSTELKKKYGVVTQHTTVILNADGSEKMKKLGARTVVEVVGK